MSNQQSEYGMNFPTSAEDQSLIQKNMDSDQVREITDQYKEELKVWKKANRKAGWPLYLLIIVLFGAIGAAGFALYSQSVANSAAVDEELLVIPVTQSSTRTMDMAITYKGNGDVVASSSVDVYADTQQGKVTRIVTDLGDRVQKDGIILWIDPSRPGQTYAPSPVRASISGTITSLNTSVGSLVSAQMPVATIGDLSNLEVVTHIPEKFVTSVESGQEARISLIGWNNEYVRGNVSEISPVVDPSSRSLRVKIRLAEADSRIRAGMFVKISMVTEQLNNVTAIPAEAIIERFDDKFVYVIENETAVRRPIVSDLSINGWARVVSGLDSGDAIAVKGNNLLEDGSKIRVVQDASLEGAED